MDDGGVGGNALVSDKRIYVEGGGGRLLDAQCREGFRKLLENSGFKGRVPRIVACGKRNDAYDNFKNVQEGSPTDYIALIVDSEDPVADTDAPWAHLATRDGWERPKGANDDQVFLMTTCMETWIITDRASLSQYYGTKFRESALPALNNIEGRDRHAEIQDKLATATKGCTNAFEKGKRSFEVLAALNPSILRDRLSAFARMIAILEEKL
ncbi:MAG: DUF4276 family protein [Fibrella sp.]|nr:DUF4276 family protein [Armatimonadota bacterium]